MKYKFKVGDRVQFKSWEEMKEEFELNHDGDIKAHCTFVSEMNNLCGTYATIDEISENGIVKLKNFSILEIDEDADIYWEYSLDMLKPAKKDLDEEIAYYEKKVAELKAQEEKEKWVFTEDEKVILRNLSKDYKWIARDKNNTIWGFERIPKKKKVLG